MPGCRCVTPFRMMALGGLLPGVAALALLWVNRPGGVVLQWQFAKDRPFIEESIIETKQRSKVDGFGANLTETVTLQFQWMPRQQDPSRNWTIQRRLQRVIHRGSDNQVVYDSAGPTPSPFAWADMYKDFVGIKSTLTVRPHTPGVLIEMPRTGPASLNAEEFKELQSELAETVLMWTPRHPVRPGDSWESDRELPRSWMGVFHARCRFTYLGRDENLDKIGMEMDLEHRPPDVKLSFETAPWRFKSGELHVEPGAGGTAWFDRNRGRLDHAELGMHIRGKIKVEARDGGESEIEIDTPAKTIINIRDMIREMPPRN
jgi:hypothetical protein